MLVLASTDKSKVEFPRVDDLIFDEHHAKSHRIFIYFGNNSEKPIYCYNFHGLFQDVYPTG